MKRGHGAVVASLLAAGALLWWCLEPSAVPPEPETQVIATAPAPVAPTAPAKDTVQIDYVDGVPIHPEGSHDIDADGMRPHAITPTHERIYRENNLIGNLNGAMDVKDVAGLRNLLRQYRDEYPEDAHVLQDGYELIADCIDRPGDAELRQKAQRYYDERLDSGLRRYIRRHCLEGASL
jgi:hypothetical protein